MLINSFHHQSVKKIGSNLIPTAISEDGIIEAFEGVDNSFLLGVQWHPKCLTKRYPKFLKLFEAFAASSGEYRQKKG